MSTECRFEGCTVGDTGRCALENDPDSCPNRAGAEPGAAVGEIGDASTAAAIGSPVLVAPHEAPRFPSSAALDPDTVSAMMADRYMTIVGILGEPESGKTACLASLYLQISNDELVGWSFADSRTLMAFEDIARGARRWNEGNPPEQMTVHTELADDRGPGFLHLRLRREADGSCIDFALPDLPGEWTKDLIRSAQADRFAFLKSADVIWLVVDGRLLNDREKRQGAITRLGQLTGRLKTLMDGAPMPTLLLVITHRDAGEVPVAIMERLTGELAKHGTTARCISVAPFTDDADTAAPGLGIEQLIAASAGGVPKSPAFWSETTPEGDDRAYIAYRRDR